MKYLLSIPFLVVGTACAIGSTFAPNDIAELAATILSIGFFYGFFYVIFILPLED